MIKPTPPAPTTTFSKDEIIEQKMRLLANFMIDRILENKEIKPSIEIPKNAIIKVTPSRKDGTQL